MMMVYRGSIMTRDDQYDAFLRQIVAEQFVFDAFAIMADYCEEFNVTPPIPLSAMRNMGAVVTWKTRDTMVFVLKRWAQAELDRRNKSSASAALPPIGE